MKSNKNISSRSIRIAFNLISDGNDFDRIIIAKGGILDKIKTWISDKWTGFKTVNLEKESSAIDYLKYNKKKKILEIKYKERGTYRYLPVPEKEVEKMLAAPSKGKFLNKSIKGKYRYKKIASALISEHELVS